jgi:hypothetical protein
VTVVDVATVSVVRLLVSEPKLLAGSVSEGVASRSPGKERSIA